MEKIHGRTTYYILSPTYCKVNLGNISNSTKDVKGIICFQLIQNSINHIDLKIVCSDDFNKEQEFKFIKSLRERVGDEITLDINYVDEIAKEKSGKFRIVKNLIGK